MTGTPETFLADVDAREIPWARPAGSPTALAPETVLIGPGTDGLEVAIASAASAPKASDVRALWKNRWGHRAAPVLLVVTYPDADGWKAAVCGTKDDPAVLPGIPLDQIDRICTAALAAPDPSNAERTLHRLLVGQKDQLIAGLTNQGLFASQELRTGVPARADWETARTTGTPLLSKRGPELLTALGYTTTPLGSTAQILTASGSRHAVAVLLDDTELFDRPSNRFGATSPVAQGLKTAKEQNLPWLIVTRGTQVRLYPAKPEVGVGRKGQSETFVELDLALLTGDDAGYLPLLFGPAALTEHGTVEEILNASADHAAALGHRLRDRVYVDVVPRLAVAVANQMGATTEDDLHEAYHRTLIILFRLLFVAYAEDRGLLPYQRNPRYTAKALKTLAREFTDNPDLTFDADATDRWEDLQAVWRAVDDGNREWDVPAYNGGLFAANSDHPSGAAIAAMRLTNAEIGPALKALLIDKGEDQDLGPVDFRALTVREFGSIYEGLLESSLSIAPTDLTVDPSTGAYMPTTTADDVAVRAGDIYFHNASGARKATGSYYTKAFAVNALLDSALEPAITAHLDKVEVFLASGDDASAADAFFDFRVADLAMGSGHFLVAAIDRIEDRFSSFLAAHPIPSVIDELTRLAAAARDALGPNSADIEIEPNALLRRQIARRCIYGLDLNLMAVELARLGIWIHTFVPGLPMSSLDHGLVVGNSLTGIGTIAEALDVYEPKSAATGQLSLYGEQIGEALSEARDALIRVARTTEATKAEVREAARAHAKAKVDAADAKALLDAATAVRVGAIALPAGPEEAIRAGRSTTVTALMADLRAAHMPYLFPEVFLREKGGFDALLGNPPWEKVQVDERGFWAMHFPGLRGMPVAEQKGAMDSYRQERPDLVAQLEQEVEETDRLRRALLTGEYPGLGSGHPDLYKAFAWRFWQLLRDGGTCGLVMPRSAITSSGTAEWRTEIFNHGCFTDVTMLHNTGKWVFADVHGQDRFALLAITKGSNGDTLTLRGPFDSEEEFKTAPPPLVLDPAAVRTWGSGDALPWLPSATAGPTFVRLAEHPRFSDTRPDFRFRAVQGDFNTTANASEFVFDGSGDLPVYKGGSIGLWQPDTGTYFATAHSASIVPASLARRVNQARNSRSAFHEMPRQQVSEDASLPILHPRIAFADITNQSNTRTVIAALVPPHTVLTHKAPYLLRIRGTAKDEAYLLGVLCSIPLDWYARRYVEKTLSFEILGTFPIPCPDTDSALRARVIEIAGRLAAVDARYAEWAAEVGVPVGSVTDDPTKAGLVAELDACVALLYGLQRNDVSTIFETFHRGWNYGDRLDAVLGHYDNWKTQVQNV